LQPWIVAEFFRDYIGMFSCLPALSLGRLTRPGSLLTFSTRLTYQDAYYVEFSKAVQDRVIGTKNTKSTVILSPPFQNVFLPA